MAPTNRPKNVLPNCPDVFAASSTSSKEMALSSTPDPNAITSPSILVPGGRTSAIVAPSNSELAANNPHRPASIMSAATVLASPYDRRRGSSPTLWFL